MKEYIIYLPNEKTRTYQLVTMIIFLINAFVFGMFFMNTADSHVKSISGGGAMMSILSLGFFIINIYTKRLSSYRTEISFIIIAFFWLLLGKYLVAAFIFLFAITGFYTSRKFKVIFSADKILYPSFPVKTFLWSEVNNVILKDGVLTIDLKNNKLIQAVIEEGSDETDEQEFNEFCTGLLGVTNKE